MHNRVAYKIMLLLAFVKKHCFSLVLATTIKLLPENLTHSLKHLDAIKFLLIRRLLIKKNT